MGAATKDEMRIPIDHPGRDTNARIFTLSCMANERCGPAVDEILEVMWMATIPYLGQARLTNRPELPSGASLPALAGREGRLSDGLVCLTLMDLRVSLLGRDQLASAGCMNPRRRPLRLASIEHPSLRPPECRFRAVLWQGSASRR